MLKKNKTIYQILLMLFLILMIQITMLLINSITASKFGVDVGLDSYNFSKNISNFIFGLLGTAITTVIIPNLAKNETRDKSLNTFITFVYTILTLIMILVFIFKKYLIIFISGNSQPDFLNLTQIILNIVMISYYVLSFSNILIAIYQIKNRFNFIKFIQLISNIIVLLLLYFIKNISIIRFSLLISLGNIINFIILLLGYKSLGYNYRFECEWTNQKFKIMLKNLVPILFAGGVYQISLIIDTMLATRQGEGVLSLLSYSINIIGMINSLFIGSIVSYIYPKLAILIVQKDKRGVKLYYEYSIMIIALTILLVVGFLVVGRDFIILLLQRGKFTLIETNIVYKTASLYILSLPFSALRDISYRYLYSNNDTKTPFKNSLKTTILNIFLSIILSKYVGLYGIVLGTTLSSIRSTIAIQFLLKKKHKIDILALYWREILLIVIAGGLSFFIGSYSHNLMTCMNEIYRILIVSLIVFSIYIAFFYSLKVKIKLKTIQEEF